jgi:HTH-type transcriptional regulator / antitoxin HigA
MEGGFMVQEFQQLMQIWPSISPYLSAPTSDEEFEELIGFADYLMDHTQGQTDHPLIGLLDLVGTLIAEYERTHIEEPKGTPIGCLQYFMAEYGLKQKDLTEIGSPGVISEVMSGKRDLNKRQIKALSARFGCSPAVFI